MITITAMPLEPQWQLELTCDGRILSDGCHSRLASARPDLDQLHAHITAMGWLWGVDLGGQRRNADLCPRCKANYEAGGVELMDRGDPGG